MGVEELRRSAPELSTANGLPVVLGGQRLVLPWKNVAGPESGVGVHIAYFDPLQRIELMLAGAQELVTTLQVLGSSVLITPSSSKSGPMIDIALRGLREQTGEAQLLTLVRGPRNSPQMQEEMIKARLAVDYSPITAKKGAEPTMVLSNTDAEQLEEWADKGGKFCFVDDVYSTGETIRAMRELCGHVLGGDTAAQIPTATVLRECEMSGGVLMRPQIHGLYYAAHVPVVVGIGEEALCGHGAPPMIDRVYSESERQFLQHLCGAPDTPVSVRRTAGLALAGRVDINPQGIYYLVNHH